MDFFDMMESKLNDRKSVTTNGAIAYETSGKALLDYNFHVAAYRNKSEEEIIDAFIKVFNESKETAMRYFFYLGDIREGLGERKQFRAALRYLAKYHPDIANAVIPLVPEYNRWDSLLVFLDYADTEVAAVVTLKKQLVTDVEAMNQGKTISLCAKWMPSINASSSETWLRAKTLCQQFGWSEKKYRKTLSALRKYLDVVEVKMSSKKWNEIDYSKVPSKANLNYANAFLRNDRKRRSEYLESLQRGETKINAGVLQPHEIVARYNYWKFDAAMEEMWKALPDLTVDNTLIVRDGSGSMTWARCGQATPLDVATALAIYMSERNTGAWKDKFITFSDRPKIVSLIGYDTLREKLDICRKETDCSNTNIYATMKLILDTAVENNISQNEMPKMVVILSDMQFDGRAHSLNKSLFDMIKREFEDNGYQFPKICFWNLAGDIYNTIPMQENDLGLILCSGFSVQLLKMFMSGEVDPYKILLDTLYTKRYDPVIETVGAYLKK